jgi:hypothetical protein
MSWKSLNESLLQQMFLTGRWRHLFELEEEMGARQVRLWGKVYSHHCSESCKWK